jgi:hypothetical protein
MISTDAVSIAAVDRIRSCGTNASRTIIATHTLWIEATTKKPITERLVRSLKNISVTRGV